MGVLAYNRSQLLFSTSLSTTGLLCIHTHIDTFVCVPYVSARLDSCLNLGALVLFFGIFVFLRYQIFTPMRTDKAKETKIEIKKRNSNTINPQWDTRMQAFYDFL